MPGPHSSPADSSVTQVLARRLQALQRHRLVGILTFAAVLAIAAPFVLGLPPLYRATATLVVEGQVPEAFVQSTLAGGTDNRLQAIKQEALSRARLTELVQRYNLYPNMRGKAPMEAILDRLQRDIKINTVNADAASRPGAVAFSIAYIGRDAKTTSDVANALASFYVAQNDRMRSQQATRTTEVIRAQMDDTKQKMDAQEARMREFLSKHMGGLPQQVDSNLAALQRMNTQLQANADAQSKLMERRQTLQKQVADLDVAAATAVVPPDPTDPAAKLVRAQRELSDLQSQYRDTFPDVRAKKQEIAQLEREAANARRTNVNGPSAVSSQRSAMSSALKEAEGQLDRLSQESSALRDSMLSYEGRVESAPSRLPEYNALASDYAATRDVYDSLQKKYNDARLSESMERGRGAEEFRIPDAALPPPFAAGPNRLRLLIVALFGALVAGLGIVLAIDHFDTSFHTIDDLRSFTRVPVLVSIPCIVTAGENRRRRMRTAALLAASAAMLLLLAAGTHHVARGNELLSRALLVIG